MDAHQWARRYDGDGPISSSAPDAAVVEFVTALPSGRALDLGCGEGRHASWLALRAWRVTAVDFSTAALTRAVAAAAPLPRATRNRLTWVNADVTEIEFQPDYDLVLICDLHLPPESRRRLLRRAAGALRPGGTLVARTETVFEKGAERHEFPCTPGELVDDLGDLLTVVAARPAEVDTPADTTPASTAEVRAGALVVGFRQPVGT